ncbi:hypothetical protein BDN70DRAFT_58947 [Pholiota conissans]|uniref:ribonuclease Z n=1 Tax=Pholiota conissans TaxID=109636 RepID=A0A9P6CZD8_9AGAR|nr:hypothetical protein BDN70DRAFT_58947 [Pholiota conissans]
MWSTSVITALSSDTEPAIMLTFNEGKYIFNTSENTMRRFLQSGHTWRRTKALFFTQARIEKMGGLPGLIMTFADATITKLKLVGPSGLNHLLASMRLYTYRDSITVQPSEIPWTTTLSSEPTPCFSDENVTVYGIPAIPIPVVEDVTPDLSNLETSGKRKRDNSVDGPRKRPNTEDENATMETEVTESTVQEDPEAYRQTIIRSMFPGTNIPTPEEIAASKRGPPAVNDVVNFSNADMEQRRKKAALPMGFWKQLPKFISTVPLTKAPPTMSYLIIGPPTRGKFDVAKAVALGVPHGPLRGLLTKGETITVEVEVNGEKIQRTVRPEDVLGKAEPRGAILVLDVPTPDHIPSLVTAFKTSPFYYQFWSEDPASLSLKDPETLLRITYQTCGQGVLEDERYKAFLCGFGPHVHHMVASREHCPDPVTFTSMSQNQLRLNKLDEKIFPVPKYSLVPKKDISTISGLPTNIRLMSSSDRNVMRPYAAPFSDPAALALDKFHPLVNGEQSLELSPFLQRYITAAKEHIAEVEASGELPPIAGSDVGIVTLGTGGSLPTKYRNVLSTLVRIPGWGNVLLDAGEGTWGQLVRIFGMQDEGYNVWQALRDLKCIFISHVHADHHIGLGHILAMRSQLDPPPKEPIYVVSIRNVHLYLREMQDVQDVGVDDPSGNGVVHVLSESLHFHQLGSYVTQGMWQIGGDEDWLEYNKSVENSRKMCDALGLEYFKTADVEHRCRAFGASFKHKDGWSITFSGDTSPSPSLRELGMNSTVLIHEATMDDEEIVMAQRKAHSTMSQAIAEGEKMNAQNILLTHFSARYPKIPPFILRDQNLLRVTPATYRKDGFIVPAFDYLNLTIGDMWKMQFYLRPLVQAIHEGGEIEQDDDIARSRSPSPMRFPPSKKNKQVSRREPRSSKKGGMYDGRGNGNDRNDNAGRRSPSRTMSPAPYSEGSRGSTQDRRKIASSGSAGG